VLQEREVERVGGVRRIPIRARILAATHRTLAEEVKAGRFREDLYQRLKVVTLTLPPLRERPEDVPVLVEHLLMKINQRLHKNLRRVPREVIEKLQKRDWPGNVRELENVLMRAAVMSQGDLLLEEHLLEPKAAVRPYAPPPPPDVDERVPTLEEVERSHIVRVWALTGGHRGKTCQILGISRPTLERKLRKYGLAGDVD
jgi:two-component system response regulator AtoC